MKPNDLPLSPFLSAGIFSKLFFIWLFPLFQKGNKKDLEYEDIYQTLPDDRSKELGDRLALEWQAEVEKCRVKSKFKNSKADLTHDDDKSEPTEPKRPSLFKALTRMFFLRWAAMGIFLFIEECIAKISQPLCLGLLLRYFNGEFDEKHGYLFAGGVVICTMYYTASHHPSFFSVMHMNMKIRIACSALVYKKSLNLSQAALGQTTVGQLVNILSNDVARFDFALSFLHYMWIGPVQLGLIIWILWGYFGVTCLSGVVFLVLFTPFQSLMGHCFSKLRLKVAGKTDKRIRVMNEIINGIRVIKMYAWEVPFSRTVGLSREDEIKTIGGTLTLRAMNLSLCYVASKIVVFLTLVTYVLTGNYLTAEKVFVAMAMYQNVRLLMTIFFPLGISFIAESLVSIHRIENFLLLGDYEPPGGMSGTNSNRINNTEPEVCLKHITAKWNSDASDPTLSKISCNVKKGELLAVAGSVGSGKSSLLQVILHELPVSSGEIKVVGTIAYVAQEAWVFSGTVRENILFGKPYDAKWYRTVVDSCALSKDYAMLSHGDKTAVGDKGLALSGGQKARINLARAVYSNADVYLLDDPLSAVDAEIGRHLFEQCIRGILGNKICILVTHQLQFLPKAKEIILLNNGKVIAQGTYSDLQNIDVNITEVIPNAESNENLHEKFERRSSLVQVIMESVSPGIRQRKGSVRSVQDELIEKEVEEIASSGNIGIGVYWKYVRAGSNLCVLAFLLFSNLLTQLLYSGSDYWLQYWIKAEQSHYGPSQPENIVSHTLNKTFPWLDQRVQQISFYTGLIGILFTITLIRTVGFFRMCMRSSVALHRQLFYGVLRAPMLFFEQNPVGRILNRFTKDIGTIDELLPFTLFDTVEVGLQVVGIIVIVSVISPVFLIPSAFIAVMFYVIRKYFQNTARDLKRLEGMARSPVFSHLSTSICGLTTIRAFNAQDRFQSEFETHLDLHSATFYLFIASARWLGIVVDWISVLYIAAVSFGVVALKLDGAAAGLAISSAMSLTSWFQWGVRQSAEAENQMVSVERVLEYTDVESEASLESFKERKPPADWPSKGEIQFKNLFVKYGDGPPFLKNICCDIQPLEKIGIVGRTGAGKTSFISALFRLTEPCQGTIVIDEVSVLEIGLHDLRSKISIIPQDPVLFRASLRKNFDPLEEYSDAEIWEVLQDVHLFDTIRELPSGLDSMVMEGGGNLSVGQRQLVCMGRAILRKNKILVMDEATANVDPETDALIQNTIRTKFVDCTVLTIAHRLHTVIDSDRIMVLDSGTIKEFDEPNKLLQDKRGALYHLVQETGRETADKLINAARSNAESKNLPEDSGGDDQEAISAGDIP